VAIVVAFVGACVVQVRWKLKSVIFVKLIL